MVFAFAPFNAPPVAIAALTLLFWLWQRAPTPRTAALQGFCFGLGLFGAGVSWVFIALETFSGMPAPIAVVATAGFVAYLALWPALAGYVVVRLTREDSAGRLLAAAAAWLLAEWLRGYVFTGFPWLAVGYASLLPTTTLPFAGYAPGGGVFAVSLAIALVATALAAAAGAIADDQPQRRRVVVLGALGAGIVALALGGVGAARIEWTTPHGDPVAVSLVQGNVSQAEKFDPAFRQQNQARYLQLVRLTQGRVVVLPESAYPQFADEIPGAVFVDLAQVMRARDGGVLVGLFVAEPPQRPGEGERIYNSVVSIGEAPPQFYRKHHLVPFGESIPLKPIFGWFFNRILAIPLADQAAGPAVQPPVALAGQRFAVNICYEDVFGAELIANARAATVLVNVTNDAWYGRSVQARQHNQIAQMRALETGRPMLRATNTGITSEIGHDGRVVTALPWFVQGILEIVVTGRTGETPYVRFGDTPVLLLSLALLALGALFGRRR